MKLSLQDLYKNNRPCRQILLLSSFEEDVLERTLEGLLQGLYNPQKQRPVTKLPASLLKTDPYKILETLTSPPLFGPPAFLIVEKMTDGLLSFFSVFLEKLPSNIFFIMTAGYLKKTSSLRIFFEASSSLVHVPLYAPTLSHIEMEIKSLLESYGHQGTRDLLVTLSQVYYETPHLIKAELIPFCLYFKDPSLLKLEDYSSFKRQNLSTEIYYLEAFLLKKQDILTSSPASFSFISFLRLLNFHIIRLLEIRPVSSGGSSLKLPNLSLKDKALYEGALRAWTQEQFLKALHLLHSLEKDTKRGLQEPTEAFRNLMDLVKKP